MVISAVFSPTYSTQLCYKSIVQLPKISDPSIVNQTTIAAQVHIHIPLTSISSFYVDTRLSTVQVYSTFKSIHVQEEVNSTYSLTLSFTGNSLFTVIVVCFNKPLHYSIFSKCLPFILNVNIICYCTPSFDSNQLINQITAILIRQSRN